MSPRVTIQLTVFGRGYSPPPRGGVDATSRKYREASFEERTGWSLTSPISECVLNRACERRLFLMAARYRACADSVRRLRRFGGFATFSYGAATPPLGGREYPARTIWLRREPR